MDTDKKSIPSKFKITIVIIGFLVIFLGGFMYSYRFDGYGLLQKWNLIPVDEHFTELYFENYPNAEQTYLISGNTVLFSFTVNNLEGADTKYPYRVYFKPSTGNTTSTIDSGAITIKDTASSTIKELFVMKGTMTAGTFVVDLTSKNQQIFFSIPIKN